MSKIFDSLKKAEATVDKQKHAKTAETKPVEMQDHRRTCRGRVKIPLLVYGYGLKGAPFFGQAHTIEINAHGVLIAMKAAMAPGERLLLTNQTNQRTQEGTVLAVTARQGQDVQIAIEFTAPSALFWRKSSQKPSQTSQRFH